MSGLPNAPLLDESENPDLGDRFYAARLYYAIHNNLSKREVGTKFGILPDRMTEAAFYQRTQREGWNEWREGYRELVNRDFEKRGRAHLTAQLARNRRLAEKIGAMVETIDTNAGNEWNPRQRVGNIESLARLQRAHSENTQELLRIYEKPTEHVKHSGAIPDSNDPVVLLEQSRQLAKIAEERLAGITGSGTGVDGGGIAGGVPPEAGEGRSDSEPGI